MTFSNQMYSECPQKVPTCAIFDSQLLDSDQFLPSFMSEQEECMWGNQEIKQEPDFEDYLTNQVFRVSADSCNPPFLPLLLEKGNRSRFVLGLLVVGCDRSIPRFVGSLILCVSEVCYERS